MKKLIAIKLQNKEQKMDNKTEATALKSVSGQLQGELRFVNAKKLADAGTTGVVAEGTYEGRQDEQTKFGPKSNVKVRAANGDLLIVNDTGNLDYRMSQAVAQGLSIGDAIQISYLGKTPMKRGPYAGTMSHSFDVAIESAD